MKQDIIIVAHQTEGFVELKKVLRDYEMDVIYYTDVHAVKARLALHSPAFILLDYDIVGMNFLLKEIMTCSLRPHPYIIVATHFPDGAARASMLREGADACVEKIVVAEEVLAMIEAVLRRERRNKWFHQGEYLPCVEYLELKIDPLRRQVIMRGEEIALTAKEFEILHFLASRAGIVFTKEEIYKNVWSIDLNLPASIITDYISSIRRKLGLSGRNDDYIQTIYGVGYCFRRSGDDV